MFDDERKQIRSLWDELQDIADRGLTKKDAGKFARMIIGYMIVVAVLSFIYIILSFTR